MLPNKARLRKMVSIGLAATAGLWLASCLQPGNYAGLDVGKQAPEIEARGWLNGEPPSPGELEGKVVVVDAWASW